MERYLKVYITLLKLNLQSMTAYRMNFINSIISSSIWGIISFFSIFVLATRTNGVLGWSAADMLILTGVYNIVTGTFHVIFSRNFERLSRIMHYGEFDSLLIKPLDTQFSISLWQFNYASIFRIILGILILGFILNSRIFAQIYLLPVFMIVVATGIALMYSLWLLIGTLMVKFSNLSNLIGLLYEMNGFARYPNDIYSNLGAIGFSFFIPLTIMITLPAKVVTHKFVYSDLLTLILTTLIFLILSRTIWKFALRFYTSASG